MDPRDEIRKMFEEEERLLEESHEKTMEQHKEIMEAIERSSVRKVTMTE